MKLFYNLLFFKQQIIANHHITKINYIYKKHMYNIKCGYIELNILFELHYSLTYIKTIYLITYIVIICIIKISNIYFLKSP